MNQIYRRQEQINKEFLLLAGYSLLTFASGIFLSTFDVLVHARFIEVFGYRSLAASYIVGGFAGVLFTYLYPVLFRRISTRNLNLSIFTLILLLAGTYLTCSFLFTSRNLAFFGMVLLFPVNVLMMLAVWQFGRKMLTPIQSRNITPKARLAYLAGFALGGLITTLSLYFFYFRFITLFSLMALTGSWMIHLAVLVILRKRKLIRTAKEKYVPVSNNIFLFLTSPLSRYLLLFTILSAMIGFSIHFVFINLAGAGFQNIIGVSKFYGLFLAALMVFIYGIDRFLIKKILYSYDSPYSLILIPAVMLFTLAASMVANLFFTGLYPHENFTLFFLFLTLTKVGYESLKAIVQIPSSRTLYQALDIRFKQVAHPRIEGSAIMLGLALSGAFILALSFLRFFNLNLIMYWITLLTLGWGFVGYKLLKQYQADQVKALNRLRYKQTMLLSKDLYQERIWSSLANYDSVKINCILNTLSELHPMDFEKYLIRLLAHPQKEIRQVMIGKILEHHIFSALPELKKLEETGDEDEMELLRLVENTLKLEMLLPKKLSDMRELTLNGNKTQRLKLANSLQQELPEIKEEILFELIKDPDPDVQHAGIRSLARSHEIEFNYILLDYLYPSKYNPYAIEALCKTGHKALDYLEREQMLPDTPEIVKVRIARVYGKMGSLEALDKILANLATQEQFVLMQNLQTLIDCHFQASSANKYKLLSFFIKQAGIITSNLNLYHSSCRKKGMEMVAEAYRQEIDKNYDLIFKLLSLIYNPQIIASIKHMLLDGSHSQVNHAIELVDTYFDEDIKPIFFPLVENISHAERLKRLENFFIQPTLKREELLRTSLTSDFNVLSYYPRACVMLYILQNKLGDFEEEIIFNAYHQEPLLSETAIYVLLHLHPHRIKSLMHQDDMHEHLTGLIKSTKSMAIDELFIFRFIELKAYSDFAELSEQVALQLARHARKVELKKGASFDISLLAKQERLIMTQSTVFKGGKNCVILLADNFLDISLLHAHGIDQLVCENAAEMWLFPEWLVKNMLHDHIDFANKYFLSIENLKVIKE